jgi:GXWXG protein/uncharacterized protein DUF4334
MMPSCSKLLVGKATTNEALAIFDRLEAVDTGFMLGAWKGEGFATDHPLDGALEAYHWHGKRFESLEHVHPLVFRTLRGSRASVNPAHLMPAIWLLHHFPFLKSNAMGRIFQACIPLLATRRSRARLRTMDCRGKPGAVMIYDNVPINDAFRKLDPDTVLGMMDLKGMAQPFFFVLRRE